MKVENVVNVVPEQADTVNGSLVGCDGALVGIAELGGLGRKGKFRMVSTESRPPTIVSPFHFLTLLALLTISTAATSLNFSLLPVYHTLDARALQAMPADA